MRLLDAVNLVLSRVGEHPVTSVTAKHPTLAILLPEIELELKTCLLRGWWFNEYDYTAYPDSEGRIALGTECLRFVPKCAYAAMRGQDLYNTRTRSYKWDDAVSGRIIEYVPFDRLPESAAQFVFYKAAVNTYIQDIGLTNEVQAWASNALMAEQQLLSEHLANKKYSSAKLHTFQRITSALRRS
jgi:Tail tubular protein